MIDISLLGNSLKNIRDFPSDAKQEVGFQLDKVQRGEQPNNFKPIPIIGKGVKEIRVRDKNNIFRVIYTAKIDDVIYVLHAFQKKTQKTSKKDIDVAKNNFKLLGGN